MRFSPLFAASVLILTGTNAVAASPLQTVADSGTIVPAYADIAGLVLDAPLVADVTIRTEARIKGAEAADVAPGKTRLYVTADVNALLRGNAALPVQIGYVVDLPLDSRGRPPRLKNQRVLIFARTVPDRPAQLQLVALDAQRPWSPELEQMTRGIVRDVLAPNSPPKITGMTNAFYVPGTLPGEGQSQFFLTTATQQPVSIRVDHQQGTAPSWSVSFTDLVDQSMPPPQRNTFAWYRLACGLPQSLPAASVANDDAQGAQILHEDYMMVLRDLGPCTGQRTDQP